LYLIFLGINQIIEIIEIIQASLVTIKFKEVINFSMKDSSIEGNLINRFSKEIQILIYLKIVQFNKYNRVASIIGLKHQKNLKFNHQYLNYMALNYLKIKSIGQKHQIKIEGIII